MALTALARSGSHLTLGAARYSQTLVIAAVDRLARDGATNRPRLLGRVWRVPLDIAERTIVEPIEVVDWGYVQLQQLVALHQEFANRLFEAIDARDFASPTATASNVIRFMPRTGS